MRPTRKLLLFDIDGTLIRSGGIGSTAMLEAVSAHAGKEVRSEMFDFSGSTDRKIIRTLILRNEIATEDIDATIDIILEDYLERLAPRLEGSATIRVMPGIYTLLDLLREDSRFLLGLLTGNLATGARLKLAPVDLNRYFRFGAFGSDAEDRNKLPPIGIERAEALSGIKFDPADAWIIGDTPRDIECARVNGLRVLAVSTGLWRTDQLAEHQPDLVMEDLSDTDRVLQLVGTPAPRPSV